MIKMDKIAIKWLSVLGIGLMLTGCQSISKPIDTTTNITPIETTIYIDGDDDQDGVLNSIDTCPNTPKNVVVEGRECPIEGGIDISLRMERRIFYPNNQTTIPKQAFQLPADTPPRNFWQEVTDIAKKWHKYPNATIYIEGHASKLEGKSDTERLQLSKLRASTVKYTLIHQFGVAPSKIFALGYGTNRPIADDTTLQGSDFNRRVYIMLSDSSYFIDNLIDKQGNPKPVPSDGEIAD